METDTTLVRANGIVVLHTVAHVVVDLALVVDPRHAERENPVGNAKALDEIVALELGILVVNILDGAQHLVHCLDVLGLIGKTTLQVVNHFYCFHTLNWKSFLKFSDKITQNSSNLKTFDSKIEKNCPQ